MGTQWKKSGFDGFMKGTFGNGGQNIYVSANGVLQRIFNYDFNSDGYPDIPISNSHTMDERPPLYVLDTLGQKKPLELPTEGTFDAVFADLTGDGTEDLIVCCQHNGVHAETSGVIYFGSEMGLTEKYKMTLRAPNSVGVAAGDFKGDGKIAPVFISSDKIRIFYQTHLGVEASYFTELDIPALSIAVDDIDGDGYDDLYVMNAAKGDLTVYWGGEDGINIERKTDFGTPLANQDRRSSSTTAGRKKARWVPWRCCTIKLGGKVMTFRVEVENIAVLESFDESRQPHEEFRFNLYDPAEIKHYRNKFSYGGITYAAAGDLKNCGDTDLVFAVSTSVRETDDLVILWQSEGYSLDKATRIPTRNAKTLTISPAEKNGGNLLFVTQGETRNDLNVTSAVFSFDKNGTPKNEHNLLTLNATRIIPGKTYTDGRIQTVLVNNEGCCAQGFVDVEIFLGNAKGDYSTDNCLRLPGLSAVDTISCDFNDDGKPDVLVVNCGENAPDKCIGSFVYWNKDGEFDKNNKTILKSLLAHGCALGDFRKSGYIDIMFSGIHNRQLYLFEGGPNGWPEEPKRITFGPEPEKFSPFLWEGEDHDPDWTPEERKLISEFGEPRWLLAADFNGDGWLDVFVTQIASERSVILWGGPEGFSVERAQWLATGGSGSANAADLNGDGYLDLVIGIHRIAEYSHPTERGGYVVYWGGPNGYSENRKSEIVVDAACNLTTIGDLNNDGKLDIYGTAYNNGRKRDLDSYIYFGSDDGAFHFENKQRLSNNSGCGCMAADFNGDGYIDLAIASHKKEGHHVCDSFIYWGGPDGINDQRYTKLPTKGPHGMCSVDIGNIMDRGDSEYYYSEAYEIPKGSVPTKVSWTAENGPATKVTMQVRCAHSPEALENSPWQGNFESGDTLELLSLHGYMQYRLALTAKCGCGTPRITEVTVDFR